MDELLSAPLGASTEIVPEIFTEWVLLVRKRDLHWFPFVRPARCNVTMGSCMESNPPDSFDRVKYEGAYRLRSLFAPTPGKRRSDSRVAVARWVCLPPGFFARYLILSLGLAWCTTGVPFYIRVLHGPVLAFGIRPSGSRRRR